MTEFLFFVACPCCRYAVVCRDLKILYSFLLELQQHFFFCDIFLSFNMITLLRQSFLCFDNILFIPQTCMSQHRYPCHNTVSMQPLQVGVVTQVSMFFLRFQSRQCFLSRDSVVEPLLQIGVATQLFLSQQHFCFGSCCNTVLHYCHLDCDPKVYHDRVLSPLNLFPCCSFIFYVAT